MSKKKVLLATALTSTMLVGCSEPAVEVGKIMVAQKQMDKAELKQTSKVKLGVGLFGVPLDVEFNLDQEGKQDLTSKKINQDITVATGIKVTADLKSIDKENELTDAERLALQNELKTGFDAKVRMKMRDDKVQLSLDDVKSEADRNMLKVNKIFASDKEQQAKVQGKVNDFKEELNLITSGANYATIDLSKEQANVSLEESYKLIDSSKKLFEESFKDFDLKNLKLEDNEVVYKADKTQLMEESKNLATFLEANKDKVAKGIVDYYNENKAYFEKAKMGASIDATRNAVLGTAAIGDFEMLDEEDGGKPESIEEQVKEAINNTIEKLKTPETDMEDFETADLEVRMSKKDDTISTTIGFKSKRKAKEDNPFVTFNSLEIESKSTQRKEPTLQLEDFKGKNYNVSLEEGKEPKILARITPESTEKAEKGDKVIMRYIIGEDDTMNLFVLDKNETKGSYQVDYEVNENSSYLPLRFISEALGEKVEWNQKDQKAYILQGDKKVAMTGRVVNNRTYVKVRDFEKLGYRVNYQHRPVDGTQSVITIEK
jgi:hypothetical protein